MYLAVVCVEAGFSQIQLYSLPDGQNIASYYQISNNIAAGLAHKT